MTLGRLDRLSPLLSARERARLMLRGLKAGLPEDPSLSRSMPSGQARDLDFYLRLMGAANVHFAHLITFLEGEAGKLELRLALLASLKAWQEATAGVGDIASLVLRQPISASAYAQLAAEQEQAMLPVAELAPVLAEQQAAWGEDDLEALTNSGLTTVKQAAWRRRCREAEAQIGAAVDAGELEGEGEGRQLQVRAGSFYAWLGQPMPVRPAWAAAYEVLPDTDVATIAVGQAALSRLETALAGPAFLATPHGPSAATVMDTLARGIVQGLMQRWQDVRGAELVLEDMASHLDGDDLLKPETRQALDYAHTTLESVHEGLASFIKVPPLADPEPASIQDLKALSRRKLPGQPA